MRIRFFAIAFFWGFLQFYVLGQASFGESIKMNDDWMFKNKDYNDEFKTKSPEDSWKKVTLPHDWSVEGVYSPDLASCTGYLPGGIGWYKKTFQVFQADKGKLIFIYFGGVYCNSEVWINGHLLGKRPNGYVPFMYDMTSYLNFEGQNTVLVKVDHSKSADSRWYTGSGVCRDVYLIKANPIHIDQWGITCSSGNVTLKRATVDVKTIIRNTTLKSVSVTISQHLTQKGKAIVLATVQKNISIAAASTGSAALKMDISSPLLWSVAHPNLYEVHTVIHQNKKIIDSNTQQVGIRTVVFDENKGFSLNGEHMKLKGVCLHHDAGALGSAVPRQVWESRLKQLKSLGCNSIRTSHNSQENTVYDICDEIGLMVMDEAFDEWEFPKRKWVEGWNVGTPVYQGYSEYFNDWGEKDITDMVMAHKNHPSIIMWSIGNEVDYPNDPYSHPVLDKESIDQKAVLGYKPTQPDAGRLSIISKKLVECVRNVDSSRPVTAALAGVIMSNHTDYPFVLDVTGYNYTESRYKMDHEKYPKRVLYGSETRHELEYWEMVKNNDYVAGQFLWTGIDYLGEAGSWPSRGFACGLLDLSGFRKPLAYYRQSIWSDKPMVYLATMPGHKNNFLYDLDENWSYMTGEKVKVACFTNCEKVILKINGIQVDATPYIDQNTGGKCWEIDYEPGVLSVVGYNAGKEAATCLLKTSGQPDAIVCKSDVQVLNVKGDIAQIILTLVDKNGSPVFLSDNEINCKISGPARLLGMENGNMADMVSHKTNKLRVFHGRLIAYVEIMNGKGPVEVEFSSNWLKSFKLSMQE